MVETARLEIFRHALASVADEMGATLQRAAHSANIKERLDFSCAVFDAAGRLLAQAAHIPVHLGAMPAAVAAARAGWPDWRAGDVLLLNDPSAGGSHLPDLTTVSPVFAEAAEPIGYVATRAHHADIGGAAPGSMPLVTELVAEGLVLPPVPLARAGVVDPSLLAVICANSRAPEERRGDLAAQLAAQQLGARRAAEVARERRPFGATATALLDHTAALARHHLAALGAGAYRAEATLAGDGFQSGPVRLRLSLRLDGAGGLVADFDGTDAQTAGPMNAPLAVTCAAVYYVVACLLPDVPINSGTFASVEVDAPAGSVLNPGPGAAVAAGNVETSQRVVDLVLAALAGARPGGLPASSQGTMNNVLVGGQDPATGRRFTYYETLGGGAGAGPAGPGASALQVHMTNTRNTPVESLEVAYPIQVDGYGLRRGSGGAGRHRGGDGLVRSYRFLGPVTVTLLTERRDQGPPGLAGGQAGRPGENELTLADRAERLPDKLTRRLPAGARLTVRTPGGGGWGPPATGSERGQKVEDDQQR
jgi:N-methylhydantoinase B